MQHLEQHFSGSDTARDVVIGMADGLAVPPLAPYMRMHDSGTALGVSAALTLLALAVFGFVKGHFTGVPKLKGALQTALVGSLAAGVAYVIAKSIA